jgi:hypothetical protein
MRFSTVVVAVAFVAAPGVGLMFAMLSPGRASLPVRLAVVVPFGYAFIGAAGFVLALAHAMTRPSFFVLYAAGTAAAWLVGLRRHGIAEHVRAWRAEVAGERWPYLLGLLLVGGMAAVRLTYSGIFDLFDQTPLRYWADGLEIADAHRVPALSLQWGHLFPSTTSKVFLNCFNAAASFALGRGPVASMGALLFVTSMGVVVGAFALAREMGLRWTAPLLVLILFADRVRGNRELTSDLMRYKAEDVGRMLILVALVFVVRALRHERWRDARADALVAGALFGVAVGTHLVPVVVGVALATGYAVAWMVLRRTLIPVLRIGAVAAGAAVLVGGVVLFAPRGDIGFQGASNTAAYRALAAELHEPACWDPTLYLSQNVIEQPCHQFSAGFYNPPSYIYREFVRRTVGEGKVRTRYLILLPVGYAVAVVVLLVWGSADLKATAVAAAVFAALVLAATLYFSYRYGVYAIAQFGERRLFDYTGLPVAVLALGVFEVLIVRAAGRLPAAGGPRPWVAPVAAVLAFVVMAAVLLPRDRADGAHDAFLATALGPLSWIERNAPCQGRILADRRTLATFEVYTRRAGVLEGMGPYLRPDVLTAAIRSMLSARQFFLDPAVHEQYLRRQGIWAVVVTAPGQPLGGALKVAHLDLAALDAAPFLRVVARSASVTVYRYTGYDPEAASTFPPVARLPGYGCAA